MEKMLNIFEYIDFRLFLKDYYTIQKKETRFFSYRYFSNKAGFSSHNVLKQVINGDRNLAIKSVPKFCKVLQLSARECDYFRLLVLFNQSKNEKEKNDLFQEIVKYKQGSAAKRLTELQYKMYSEWYHAVIRELITVKEFSDDYGMIAKMLCPQITPGQAKKSLQLLADIGLIKKGADGKWKQCDPIIKTDPEVESLSIRNYNRKMILLAADAIESVPPAQREISSMTLGISPEAFKKIKAKIKNFKDEILNDILLDTDKSEDVFQINFQFFPMVKKNKQEVGDTA